MPLQSSEEYEYKIRDENNRREICEQTLDNISYNGDFSKNAYYINKNKLEDIINRWKKNFSELSDELELWKHSEGNRCAEKEMLRPLHRGKKIKCVFLKIYDSEEENILRCVSISVDISIKVKIKDIFFKLIRRVSEDENEHIRIIKSNPEIMVALILSKRDRLKIIWER